MSRFDFGFHNKSVLLTLALVCMLCVAVGVSALCCAGFNSI
jgi:hypothetical protein